MSQKIKWLLIIYGLLGISLYHFQEDFIFHPDEESLIDSAIGAPGKRALNIRLNKQDSISILACNPQGRSKGLLLFFYPNFHQASHYARRADFFTDKGYEVWIPDYPGFGSSCGEMTEAAFYKWADQVFRLASSRYSTDSIMVYGQSFGACMAAYLGSYNFSLRSVILESPYYSMESQLRKYAFIYPVGYLSRFEFPVWKFLDDTRSPVIVFSGKRDEIVSSRDMKRLKKHLKKSDRWEVINEATHFGMDRNSRWSSIMHEQLGE